MKNVLKTIPLLLLFLMISSCSSVRVTADFDRNVNFKEYKTFAFFKTGIDKAEINDLDKRRILRAIEAELLAKGYTKSENPDILVSIFTKSNQRVDVYNNYWGYGGWGWGGFYGSPWGWGWGYNQPYASTTTEGVLYIDLLDANKKELVWQGMGTGYLTQNVDKKTERINQFVAEILSKYPPQLEQ